MPSSLARAKARTRSHAKAASRVLSNHDAADEALQLCAADVVLRPEGEAPFAPPPIDDIFGLAECEGDEETEFVAPPREFEGDDAPFDPPDFDEDPVFSAPSSAGLGTPFVAPALEPAAVVETALVCNERPLPAISVYASWDRTQAEALMRGFAADPRLGRAEISVARGGLDGAIAFCAANPAPDLVILDTNLNGRPMLQGLDRLRAAAPRASIIILGAVNDITLLRELAIRGIDDYLVPPATAADIMASALRLFADATPAHVIAVVGARGGVGASTLAQNLAWSIAERQRLRTTLADFDLSGGAAAFNFQLNADVSVSDLLTAEAADEKLLDAALTKLTPRLQLACAPEQTSEADIDAAAFQFALAELRRTASWVVLDLPHLWAPWVREALRAADEVVMVAGPDLASLRNADNMLKLLRAERDKPAPKLVLSMTGVPKRPEIPTKEFAQATHVEPVMSFAFEPELFGQAAGEGRTLYEVMADAKAAMQVDELASLLTGRAATAEPAFRSKAPALVMMQAETAPLPVLELVHEAPKVEASVSPEKTQRPRIVRTGYVSLQNTTMPKPMRRSSGLIRKVAVVALALMGAYYASQLRGEAAANQRDSVRAFEA